MRTKQIARNIVAKYSYTEASGESRGQVSQYIMAPDSGEIWREYRAFGRGRRETVQNIVNLAYWHFLAGQGAQIEAHLIPPIPFKFDRKTKDAVVTLASHGRR